MTDHGAFTAWIFESNGKEMWAASCNCGEQFGAPFKTIIEALDAARSHYEDAPSAHGPWNSSVSTADAIRDLTIGPPS